MSLVIRAEQLRALSLATQERRPVETLVYHLQECFPVETARMGLPKVHEFARTAHEKCARQYSISDTLGSLYYINLCMVLGEGFEEQGPFSWTGDVLRREGPGKEKFDEIFRGLELGEEEWEAD